MEQNQEMNIEIVEFYPINNPKNKKTRALKGTVHCYLADLGIDLRGIRVYKTNKNFVFIKFPEQTGVDEETGEKVSYPVFSFLDTEKTKKLAEVIRKKLCEYIPDFKKNMTEFSENYHDKEIL